MRALICSGQAEAVVTLNKPSRQDAADYLCEGAAPQVRLVQLITPDCQTRVVATNLPARDFPSRCLATCTISAGELRNPTSGSNTAPGYDLQGVRLKFGGLPRGRSATRSKRPGRPLFAVNRRFQLASVSIQPFSHSAIQPFSHSTAGCV